MDANNDTDEPAESDVENAENVLNNLSEIEPNLRKTHKNISFNEKRRLGLSVSNAISQYIDNYVLCGFDTHGNSVVIVNSRNNMESRALADLLGDFVENSDIMNGSYIDDEEDED